MSCGTYPLRCAEWTKKRLLSERCLTFIHSFIHTYLILEELNFLYIRVIHT